MRILILILIPLLTLSVIEPAHSSQGAAFDVPADCAALTGGSVATHVVLQCEIAPSDNGYVDNLLPTKSFGGTGILIVQNVPSVPVGKNDAFLKFDLADNLPSGILLSGAKPENASLQMYVRLMNFFYNATVEIHDAASENWTENTLTWNTMPQYDAAKYVPLNIMQNGTWARWNVTGLVPPLSNSSAEVSFAAISSETSWRNLIWFDSDEYPYANGTTSPTLELTFVEPYLTIETPFPSIPISVAGNSFYTGADGGVKLPIPWGDYVVTVPDTISISNGTRAQFVDWSDGVNGSSRLLPVGNNVSIRANYGTQHELRAFSPYGAVNGVGWYFQNSDAHITISPTAVPAEGIEGWLGARYVFDHWTGACTGTTPQCDPLMDHPQYVEAAWRVDWSQTMILVGILAITGTLLALLKRRNPGFTRTNRKSRSSNTRHRRSRVSLKAKRRRN